MVVENVTEEAFKHLSEEEFNQPTYNKLPPRLSLAIKAAMGLQGVGPATATLICAVYNREVVPFFSDEIYELLCPGKGKLKYNIKEYEEMFAGVWEMRHRLDVDASEIEKVAFVVRHRNMLDGGDASQKAVALKMNETVEAAQDESAAGGGSRPKRQAGDMSSSKDHSILPRRKSARYSTSQNHRKIIVETDAHREDTVSQRAKGKKK